MESKGITEAAAIVFLAALVSACITTTTTSYTLPDGRMYEKSTIQVDGQQPVTVVTTSAPPPIPGYDQPPCPGDGYQWMPGYWALQPDRGYYWVPGTWVIPPAPDLYWTPGYWAQGDGGYGFHPGSWGPEVGYYGDVNYGHGYPGTGYQGGHWDHGTFTYNRTVTNVGRGARSFGADQPPHPDFVSGTINEGSSAPRDTGEYGRPRTSPGPRFAPTEEQRAHELGAQGRPELYLNANGGHPPIAATSRAGAFDHD